MNEAGESQSRPRRERAPRMSVGTRLAMGLCAIAFLAACAKTDVQSTLDPAILEQARATMTAQLTPQQAKQIYHTPVPTAAPTGIIKVAPEIPTVTVPAKPQYRTELPWPTPLPDVRTIDLAHANAIAASVDSRGYQEALRVLPPNLVNATVSLKVTKTNGKFYGGTLLHVKTVTIGKQTVHYFLTVGHVVGDFHALNSNKQIQKAELGLPGGQSFSLDPQTMGFTVDFPSDVGMFAVATNNIKLPMTTYDNLSYGACDHGSITTTMTAFGFPYVAAVRDYVPFLSEGASNGACLVHPLAHDIPQIVVDGPFALAAPGISGAPVVEKSTGQVLGLINQAGPNSFLALPIPSGVVNNLILLTQAHLDRQP